MYRKFQSFEIFSRIKSTTIKLTTENFNTEISVTQFNIIENFIL